MTIYIQIGAGAGDLDVNFPDGFTDHVKSLDKNSIEKIFLVEANPKNITKLKECWKDYPQAEIYNLGIKPSDCNENDVTFYYAKEDGPNYQVFSMVESHVKKHFDSCTIEKEIVSCMDINKFLKDIVKDIKIELMAFDIEGIDHKVILDVDWDRIDCKKFSFEKIHLGAKYEDIENLLFSKGLTKITKGLDLRGYDVMFYKEEQK
jgi:hypothetical protein